MIYASCRCSGNIGKAKDGGKYYPPKKSLEQRNHRCYQKDSGMYDSFFKFLDERCVIFQWVFIELDESCKILAPVSVPLMGSDLRSGTEVKMEKLVYFDLQDNQTGYCFPDHVCHKTSRQSKSDGRSQSKSNLSISKETKPVIPNGGSNQNCNFTNAPVLKHDCFIVANSSEQVQDDSKVCKPSKKGSRKKTKKKKGRIINPSSCDRDVMVSNKQGLFGISVDEVADTSLASGDDSCSDLNSSYSAITFSDTRHEVIMEMISDGRGGIDATELSVTALKATSCDVEFLEKDPSSPQDSLCVDPGSERPSVDTSSADQTLEVIVSGEEDWGANQKEISSNSEATCVHISDEYAISCALDPFSVYCNNKFQSDGNDDIKTLQPANKKNVIHPSEGNALTECINFGASFDNVISENYNSNNRISDSDQLVAEHRNTSERRNLEGSNGTLETSSGISVHSWTVEDNSNSDYEAFHKSDEDECFETNPVFSDVGTSTVDLSFIRSDPGEGLIETGPENSIVSACLDRASIHTHEHEPSIIAIADDINSLETESDSLVNRVSEMEGEPSSRSKKGDGQNAREDSRAVTPSSLSFHSNNYKFLGHGSGNSLCFSYDNINLPSSEPFQYSEFFSKDSRQPEDAAVMDSKMDSQTLENQPFTLFVESDSLVKLEVESRSSSEVRKDRPEGLCLESCNGCGHLDQQISASQSGKNNLGHTCGFNSQKSDLIGRIDAETIGNFSKSHEGDGISNSCGLMNSIVRHMSSLSECDVPLVNVGVTSLVPSTITFRAQEMYKQTGHVFMNDIDSKKISQAVNDAYRTQIKSDVFKLATGWPLAEFERLLHSASPVLDQTFIVKCCSNCHDWPIGHSIPCHHMSSIHLGRLWSWYEMHGSYGLEVKTKVSHRKRYGNGHHLFRAYFVPFLSAVQLFGHSRNSMITCDLMSNDFFSASRQNQENERLVSNECFSHSELLFEYFESEPPHKRWPLYEMIHALIRGNAPSNSRMCGDPSKLQSLHLHDLHPSSWYSVAWYPIYRIPDGNFRAAFLTFHSLGHFFPSASSDSLGEGASTVFPVVGLESCNAQDECWFEPSDFLATQMEQDLGYDPTEALNERLRTLAQTARVMARASLHKGDDKLANRHPDFEFFLSRRR